MKVDEINYMTFLDQIIKGPRFNLKQCCAETFQTWPRRQRLLQAFVWNEAMRSNIDFRNSMSTPVWKSKALPFLCSTLEERGRWRLVRHLEDLAITISRIEIKLSWSARISYTEPMILLRDLTCPSDSCWPVSNLGGMSDSCWISGI